MERVKILLFATLRDRAGGRKFVEIDLPEGATVGSLKQRLAGEFPGLKESMQTVLVAVDHEYAADEAKVQPGAEVAMFPPVSGG